MLKNNILINEHKIKLGRVKIEIVDDKYYFTYIFELKCSYRTTTLSYEDLSLAKDIENLNENEVATLSYLIAFKQSRFGI